MNRLGSLVLRADILISSITFIAVVGIGTLVVRLVGEIVRKLPFIPVTRVPLIAILGSVALLVFAFVLVLRAEVGGEAIDVALFEERKKMAVWERLLSPGVSGFLYTAGLAGLVTLVSQGLWPWLYIPVIGLLIANWVREFSTNYFLHREALDKLTYQCLRTLHGRVTQAIGLVAGDSPFLVRCAILLVDPRARGLVPHITYNLGEHPEASLSGTPTQEIRRKAWLYRTAFYAERPVQSAETIQGGIGRRDIQWAWSFPLLNGSRDVAALGVLTIDSTYPLRNLETDENAAMVLHEVRAIGIDFASMLATLIAAGPVRCEEMVRLI